LFIVTRYSRHGSHHPPYGVNRAGTIKVKPGKAFFKPLHTKDAPVQMPLLESTERSLEHHGASCRAWPRRRSSGSLRPKDPYE
jgi:hypothetical protein